MLHAIRHGAPTDRPPLLIAHGLFGSARNWGVVARRLSDAREVVAVDMRNHGASPWSDDHSYAAMAADLAQVAGRDPHDVLGHSMGGKAAMMLALTDPGLVRRLIVADIAPLAYGHTQAHLIAAMRAVDLSGITRRSEVGDQLAGAPDDGTRDFLLQSVDLPARRWSLNLDALDAAMPDILAFPATDATFDGPVLFLSGATSDYVRPEHHETILRPASPPLPSRPFPRPATGSTPSSPAPPRPPSAPSSTPDAPLAPLAAILGPDPRTSRRTGFRVKPGMTPSAASPPSSGPTRGPPAPKPLSRQPLRLRQPMRPAAGRQRVG